MEQSTWKKFENSLMHLKSFIKWKYDQQDLLLRDINLFFIQEYEFYLKTVKDLANPTIHKAVLVKKEVVFLNQEELQHLEDYTISQPRLNLVRNLFVFCCYTGLPYYEMYTFC